jgi:ketosteroid isomerase-like protein
MDSMPVGRIAAEFYDVLNSRDLDRMGSLLTEEARFYFPKTQPLIGKARILRFFQILFRQFPKLTFEVEETIAQANRGVVHWKNWGANRKEEPYENEGVTLFEFEGEKVSMISDFFKDTEKF